MRQIPHRPWEQQCEYMLSMPKRVYDKIRNRELECPQPPETMEKQNETLLLNSLGMI